MFSQRYRIEWGVFLVLGVLSAAWWSSLPPDDWYKGMIRTWVIMFVGLMLVVTFCWHYDLQNPIDTSREAVPDPD